MEFGVISMYTKGIFFHLLKRERSFARYVELTALLFQVVKNLHLLQCTSECTSGYSGNYVSS